MRIYLITGGAGFIGSNLAKRLIADNNKVYILDNLSTGLERNIPEQAIFYRIDISNRDSLSKLEIDEKIDAVFHLAAQSSGEASFDNPLLDIKANYIGTYNILEFSKLRNCNRFIFSSSMSVYGRPADSQSYVGEDSACNPVSYYGCNKLASERLISLFCKAAGIDYTIFRLFTVYGPGQNMLNMKQGMVSIYLSYLLNNLPIHVKGSLNRFRDFIYIDDVIDVFIQSISSRKAYNELFNVGASVKTSVKDLLQLILAAYGKAEFDKWVLVNGNTAGDITGCVSDTTRIRTKLDWRPKHSLEDGILKMKRWLDDTADIWKNEESKVNQM